MAVAQPTPPHADVPLPPPDALRRLLDADPSSLAEDDDDADDRLLALIEGKEDDYLSLQREIATSSTLLANLGEFLGAFQVDLASVSAELQDLRERSGAVERRGGGRRTIEKPLSALVSSIALPPDLARLILDAPVSDAWFPAVEALDSLLVEVDRRKGRVRAVEEVDKVLEGLKHTATTKIRTHLLALLRPLTASVTTNLPIVQTSVLLRHRPLYLFLLRHARPTADEVRRAYVWRARGYFETGFRRFARVVGSVAARNTETYDLLSLTPSAGPLYPSSGLPAQNPALLSASTSFSAGRASPQEEADWEPSVLKSARVDGEGVLLSWQADDKGFRLPVEACFRSLMLVLLDNASSEYTFLVRFFSPPPPTTSSTPTGSSPAGAGWRARFGSSTTALVGGGGGGADDPLSAGSSRDRFGSLASVGGRTERLPSTVGGPPRDRQPSYIGAMPALAEVGRAGDNEGQAAVAAKEERREMEALWTMVFGPALESVQAQITALLTPLPSPPHLLSLLSLLAALLLTAQTRGITPLEPFLLRQRLALWPLFQKRMDDEVAGLKGLAERAAPGGGGFMGMVTGVGGSKVKDAKVQKIAEKYTTLFNLLTALSSDEDGRMIRMSLNRLRTPLDTLITAQASKIPAPQAREAFLAGIYERMVSALRLAFAGAGGERPSAGEGTVEEIEFWRARASGAR